MLLSPSVFALKDGSVMDCNFRAGFVEGTISQPLAAALEQHTLHN
jgi:hypothetical protein